ncbi:MAG TPA: hypothetical protein PKC71_10930, partial [Ottowia sp.]|nr:hypothetical protein [Ottowia sp.]
LGHHFLADAVARDDGDAVGAGGVHGLLLEPASIAPATKKPARGRLFGVRAAIAYQRSLKRR